MRKAPLLTRSPVPSAVVPASPHFLSDQPRRRDILEFLAPRARSVNEIVDGLAQSAARGQRGPEEPEVLAALREGGFLKERAEG